MKSLQCVPYRTKQQGFTLVELIIVIVVIGILAAIILVAYSGITTSANRASVASEAKQWAKLFEVYRAQKGSLPSLANGAYCLGTGFPTGYCRNAQASAPAAYAESTGSPVITALSKVGTPPLNSKKWVVHNNVGPYLQVTSTTFVVNTFMSADSGECSKYGMVDKWHSTTTTALLCSITIQR